MFECILRIVLALCAAIAVVGCAVTEVPKVAGTVVDNAQDSVATVATNAQNTATTIVSKHPAVTVGKKVTGSEDDRPISTNSIRWDD